MFKKLVPCTVALMMLGACPPTEDEAELRVLHLVLDAGPVDIYLDDDDSALATGVSFAQSTDYLTVPTGNVTVHVVPEGEAVEEAILTEQLQLSLDERYTFLAYGEAEQPSALPLEDDDEGIEAEQIRLSITHAAVDVGTVDIWELQEQILLVEGLQFGSSVVLDIDAGARTLGLDVDRDGQADVIFEVPDLGEGVLVNVFAVVDEEGPFLLAQRPDGSTDEVRPGENDNNNDDDDNDFDY